MENVPGTIPETFPEAPERDFLGEFLGKFLGISAKFGKFRGMFLERLWEDFREILLKVQ